MCGKTGTGAVALKICSQMLFAFFPEGPRRLAIFFKLLILK